jgi:hypothetical protein
MPWGREETELCNRYVRRLAAGEFTSVSQAARSCRIELESLHKRHSNAGWSLNRRTFGAVKLRIQLRMESLGARGAQTNLQPREHTS